MVICIAVEKNYSDIRRMLNRTKTVELYVFHITQVYVQLVFILFLKKKAIKAQVVHNMFFSNGIDHNAY